MTRQDAMMNVMVNARAAGSVGKDDSRAFDLAFDAHYGSIYRLVYGLTLSREDAEDTVQEAFVRLHRIGATSLPEDAVRPWLCRVALNLAYNSLRGRRRREGHEETAARESRAEGAVLGSDTIDPAAAAETSEERGHVRRALAALPERQQRLLLLRHAGLSYREVAAVLGVAPASVGTLLARAESAFGAAYRSEACDASDGGRR